MVGPSSSWLSSELQVHPHPAPLPSRERENSFLHLRDRRESLHAAAIDLDHFLEHRLVADPKRAIGRTVDGHRLLVGLEGGVANELVVRAFVMLVAHRRVNREALGDGEQFAGIVERERDGVGAGGGDGVLQAVECGHWKAASGKDAGTLASTRGADKPNPPRRCLRSGSNKRGRGKEVLLLSAGNGKGPAYNHRPHGFGGLR